MLGALVGAAMGALGSNAVASAIGEAHDASHWRETYTQRPYVKPGSGYQDYGPAYAYGELARQRYGDQAFAALVPELRQHWHAVRGNSVLEWEDAEPAVRDGWHRWQPDPRYPRR